MTYQIHADLRIKQKVLNILFLSRWPLHTLCMSPLQISYTNHFLLDDYFQLLSSPFLLTLSPCCYHSLVTLPPVSLPNHLAICCFIDLNSYVHWVTSQLWNEGKLPVVLSTGLQEPKQTLHSMARVGLGFHHILPLWHPWHHWLCVLHFFSAGWKAVPSKGHRASFGPGLPLIPHPALLFHIYSTVHPNHLQVIQSHTLVIWAQCFIMFPDFVCFLCWTQICPTSC